jgi:hypothetical protein
VPHPCAARVGSQRARTPLSAKPPRFGTPLNNQKKLVRAPMVPQPANAARLAATLHMAAMDLCDVATKQDQRGRHLRPEFAPI